MTAVEYLLMPNTTTAALYTHYPLLHLQRNQSHYTLSNIISA